MPRISNTTQYPIINPSGSDYVVLTDVNDNNTTKTATLNSIAGVTGGIQTFSVTLVPSQIHNLWSDPIELLTCAVGEFIVLRYAIMSLDYNSNPYDWTGQTYLANGPLVSIADSEQLRWMNTSTNNIDHDLVEQAITGDLDAVFPIASGGNSLYLLVTNENPSGGDSPVTFTIGYNIITFPILPVPTNGFTFSVNTNNTTVDSSISTQYQLPLIDAGAISMDVDWGDGTTDTITSYNQAETLHTYASSGTYTVVITNEVRGWAQYQSPAALYNDNLKIINISKWGEFNVTGIGSVFYNCQNMTGTATDAPTLSTQSLQAMFSNCYLWNQPMNSWDVSGVVSIGSMLTQCSSFNQPLNSWDTSSVTGMGGVFNSAVVFDQDISSWDTSMVQSMYGMFREATAFNQDISSWDINNLDPATGGDEFCTNSGLSTANYDLLLVAWEANTPVVANLIIDFPPTQYSLGSAAETARTNLINTYNWTITDGGGI